MSWVGQSTTNNPNVTQIIPWGPSPRSTQFHACIPPSLLRKNPKCRLDYPENSSGWFSESVMVLIFNPCASLSCSIYPLSWVQWKSLPWIRAGFDQILSNSISVLVFHPGYVWSSLQEIPMYFALISNCLPLTIKVFLSKLNIWVKDGQDLLHYICHLRKHSFEQTRATWSRSTVTFARWRRQKLLAKWEERQLVCQIQLSSQIFPRDEDFKGVLFDMDTTRSVAQYLVLIQHSLLWSHAIWQKYVLFLYVYILLELYLQNSHFTQSLRQAWSCKCVCQRILPLWNGVHFSTLRSAPEK